MNIFTHKLSEHEQSQLKKCCPWQIYLSVSIIRFCNWMLFLQLFGNQLLIYGNNANCGRCHAIFWHWVGDFETLIVADREQRLEELHLKILSYQDWMRNYGLPEKLESKWSKGFPESLIKIFPISQNPNFPEFPIQNLKLRFKELKLPRFHRIITIPKAALWVIVRIKS